MKKLLSINYGPTEALNSINSKEKYGPQGERNVYTAEELHVW